MFNYSLFIVVEIYLLISSMMEFESILPSRKINVIFSSPQGGG